MVKRMLIDATHPEETRVVVVNGTRLEELDVETSTKKQIKGNIYLAKVIRVEPSLQAAFVDYGGNRHGFLAFSEIHPDYFQIPVADRQALLAAQNALTQRADSEAGFDGPEDGDDIQAPTNSASLMIDQSPQVSSPPTNHEFARHDTVGDETEGQSPSEPTEIHGDFTASQQGDAHLSEPSEEHDHQAPQESEISAPPPVEILGDDDAAEQELERRRARLLRNYKIQEVIKRRQIMLVQVVKEERGNKGAALTTYLSLAGRYCVLMPNTARGGGVSRKIINAVDRKRLKSIAQEMDVPDGMALIVRTAGSERSKLEIKRDYEYLLRMWDTTRDLTLKSTAPSLVYEEASLIKRSIRDLYSRDIDEVLVDGDEGYRLAKDYMRMLTPSHAKKVQPYKDPAVPLFYRYQVENQLDAMHNPVVQLRSGGYLVIGQTEALVAIDVNSGRATRERHIEETAVKTNLEAADEVARQLRLRDLAGLVVIDFIDMEESRNNFAVERRLKEALKNDRARIQVGRISAFGLLELSRQRLRPSLQETAFTQCPHCAGTGLIRSIESASVAILRAIEEEGIRARSSEVTVWVPTSIALYLLNQKRDALNRAEQSYDFKVYLFGDDTLVAPNFRMERVRAEGRPEEGRVLPPPPSVVQAHDEEEGDDETEETQETSSAVTASEEAAPRLEDGSAESNQRRRRRRRRRRGRTDQPSQVDMAAESEGDGDGFEEAAEGEAQPVSEAHAEAADGAHEVVAGETDEERSRRRRRGRRGGRNRNRSFEPAQEAPVPSTPLHFSRDDVADVFEAVELAELAALEARQSGEFIASHVQPASDRGHESNDNGEQQTVVQDDAAREEPKPSRRRRTPRQAKDDEAGSAADSPEAPKRRRAPARKKAPELETAEQDNAPVQEVTSPVFTPAGIPEPQIVAVIEQASQPIELPQPEIVQETVPAGPPKKGWWNKLIS